MEQNILDFGMNYDDDIIKEIAELIDCGHRCFLHTEQALVEYYPKDIDLFYGESNPWQDIIDKVAGDQEHYIQIEQMSSFQSFQVMEDFVAKKVDSLNFRSSLEETLRKPGPFRHFKYQVEQSAYREAWFDFKNQCNIDWVKLQLADHGV